MNTQRLKKLMLDFNIDANIDDLKYEISCGAYVIDNNKILMVQHKNGEHWDFPKGHMEANETKKQTAIREVLEETGIEIKIVSSKEYIVTYMPKEDVIKDVTFFVAEKIGGELTKQESEVIKAEWVDIDKVLDKITFKNSKEKFEEFLKNK